MDNNKKECTMGLIVGIVVVVLFLSAFLTLKSCHLSTEKEKTVRMKIQLQSKQSEITDKSTEIEKEDYITRKRRKLLGKEK